MQNTVIIYYLLFLFIYLFIIYLFNIFNCIVLGMGIASFTGDSFYLIDTVFLFSPNKIYKLKSLVLKVRKVLTFYVFRVLHPRVNDPLFS